MNWLRSGSELKRKKHLLWKIHKQSHKTALFSRLQSLGMGKGETPVVTGSDLVHGAFKNLHKTDRTCTMLYSSACEHSREEAKVAQAPARVKQFPWAISAQSILAYDTCNLVNISSIVVLMTVKACYLWLWKQCAKCDMPLTDCCMSPQTFHEKCFLHQVSSLTLIQTFSLWSSDSIRAQCWNTVPFSKIKYSSVLVTGHCTCGLLLSDVIPKYRFFFLLWIIMLTGAIYNYVIKEF